MKRNTETDKKVMVLLFASSDCSAPVIEIDNNLVENAIQTAAIRLKIIFSPDCTNLPNE